MVNETDADMGAVTDAPGDGARPWTLYAAGGVFGLLAVGLAAAGAWGIVQILIGAVDSAGAAVGVALAAWLVAVYYWFIGRRFTQARNIIAQAVFQGLLWLAVGYYLHQAAHPGFGLLAWALAGAIIALALAGPTRRAVGFGQGGAPFAQDD